ncbi:hypothetical protein RDABS01_004531 [Bienertia sinuspersici]
MLMPSQLQNYALYEIEEILNKNKQSIRNFEGHYLDISLIQQSSNTLILQEQLHGTKSLKTEATHLEDGLNLELVMCLEKYYRLCTTTQAVCSSLTVVEEQGNISGSTFITKLRSEGHIVIIVASFGIAALLLQCGRTTHSHFKILIILIEESCYKIN